MYTCDGEQKAQVRMVEPDFASELDNVRQLKGDARFRVIVHVRRHVLVVVILDDVRKDLALQVYIPELVVEIALKGVVWKIHLLQGPELA